MKNGRDSFGGNSMDAHVSLPETMEAIGQSDAFLQFQERLSLVASVNRPVLIIGERGTGKELAAARLHYLSKRWQAPLVTLNCAALAPALIESELFGHEAGAFTGAEARRTGRFEAAHAGTLFLDEIGTIPLQAQEKILRVVEYGTFERVGSSDSVRVDVRIVGATNADLTELTEQGRFKRDLLDRLSFEVLVLPPLRERQEDILLLANHFATRMAFELGWEAIPEFSEHAIAQLDEYPWYGNIRELKNVVERAVYRSDSAHIDEIRFDPFAGLRRSAERKEPIREKTTPVPSSIEPEQLDSLMDVLRKTEISYLRRALQLSRFNQKKAASLLGMTYHQFRWLLRKHKDEIRLVP